MPWEKCSVETQRRGLARAMLKGGHSVREISRRFGVSRQTAYKFRARFLREGESGLGNRSRRPHRSSEQKVKWYRRVLRLRRIRSSWGGRKLRWLLRQRFGRESRTLPAERTIQRWIQQAGLIPYRLVRRRAKRRSHVRASRAYCSNAVWTFDLKGWFYTGDGTKIEPLTIRDLYSRYIFWVRPLAPRNEAAVRRVCRRLFRRYGLPRVIRCDRGAPFFGDGPHGFTRLSLWWWRLGIRVEFVRRGAINNNAHEQMHRVLKRELTLAWGLCAQTQRLERWRQHYNHARPHQALQMRVPASYYRLKPAPLPVLSNPNYPQLWLTRRVDRGGEITLPSWRGSIGRAFGNLCVGLAPLGPRRYRVHFEQLVLGTLDLNASGKLLLTPY